MLRNVEDCYRDGESVRNLFVRPNQIFLTNANRADVFFKAPVDAAGKVYTILAQEFLLHTDNVHQRLQVGIASGRSGFSAGNPAPIDVVVGYVRVAGAPVQGGDFDVMSLRDRLPRGAAVSSAGRRRRTAGPGAGGITPQSAGRELSHAGHELLRIRSDRLPADRSARSVRTQAPGDEQAALCGDRRRTRVAGAVLENHGD